MTESIELLTLLIELAWFAGKLAGEVAEKLLGR